MGYPTKIQVVKRKYSDSYYVIVPVPLARALEIKKGERVEWVIKNRNELRLKRIGEDKKDE